MSTERGTTVNRTVRGLMWGGGMWLASATVLILLSSLTAFSNGDPDKLIGTLATGALYLSAIFAGIAAALGGGIVSVSATAGCVTAIVLLASAFCPEDIERMSAPVAALMYCFVAAAIMAGGGAALFVSSRSSAKPKRRKRRRR